MQLNLNDIIKATNAIGDFEDLDIPVKSIKTDSRTVEPGDVFICLCGDRFDGHTFAKEAEKKGAIALVVHRPLDFIPSIPVLLVNDTVKALGDIAYFLRKTTKAKVVAITGSCGKTTTKEIAYAVLSQKFKVGKNLGNWNNQIGVPLSIFQFQGEEDIWLLEVGINNKRDMDELGSILRPDIALILNSGPCHLQGLKDEETVAENKSKLLKYVNIDGVAIINGDNKALKEATSKYNINKIFFSKGEDIDIKFVGLVDRKGKFLIKYNNKEGTIILPFWGNHFEENLRAVLYLSFYFKLDFKDILTGLESLNLPNQRFKVVEIDKYIIIDDTYNANPMSMRASLLATKELAKNRSFAVVLGDMAELGEREEVEHHKLGLFLKTIKPDVVFYKGKCAKLVQDTYGRENFFIVNDEDEFISFYKNSKFKDGVILFKASRSIGLEKLLNKFKLEVGY
ncbi:UDP-N-acetylmuramoyl-tripeptide--D-alanyl-D-alanine ligase [Desulfonauticus submarinus]